MEFLVNSIASAANQSLLGVVITEFNPDDYRSRAKVRLYDIAQFEREYPTLSPMGFVFENNSVLVGDTVDRRAVTDSLFSYVEHEFSQNTGHKCDIVDLLLQGVVEKGYVVINPEVLGDGESGAKVILVPMKNFKVSNSSFNIYAPYQCEDGSYRTCSLLNVEDGSPTEFSVAFPTTSSLDDFSEFLRMSGTHTVGEQEYIVYQAKGLGLIPFNVSVGEAFLSYLSYNVAFYNIGEKTLKGLSPQVGEVLATPYVSDKVPRRPKVNVKIEHTYRNCKLQQIVGMLGDPQQLQEYLRTNPEANITYQWIYKAYNSPWFTATDATLEQEQLAVSCANLLVDCKKERLKCALELLSHRYYIYSMGLVNDTLGPVIRGGGIDGESLKQSDFGYR